MKLHRSWDDSIFKAVEEQAQLWSAAWLLKSPIKNVQVELSVLKAVEENGTISKF